MSDPTFSAPLSDAWAAMLVAVEARLDEAVALADARATRFGTPVEGASAAVRRHELAALGRVVEGVDQHSARAAALIAAADLALASTEELLCPRISAAESLGHRLAAWTARAIG